MPTRRVLKAVLDNVVATYASRYSEFEGYWLFGMLVADPGGLRVDLLEAGSQEGFTATDHARELGRTRFGEQLAKSRLDRGRVRAAHLELSRSRQARPGQYNGRTAIGWYVTVSARATTDLGRTFCAEKTMFVVPHNPAAEYQSRRSS